MRRGGDAKRLLWVLTWSIAELHRRRTPVGVCDASATKAPTGRVDGDRGRGGHKSHIEEAELAGHSVSAWLYVAVLVRKLSRADKQLVLASIAAVSGAEARPRRPGSNAYCPMTCVTTVRR